MFINRNTNTKGLTMIPIQKRNYYNPEILPTSSFSGWYVGEKEWGRCGEKMGV
jgi:hypothetical protein